MTRKQTQMLTNNRLVVYIHNDT